MQIPIQTDVQTYIHKDFVTDNQTKRQTDAQKMLYQHSDWDLAWS